MGTVHFVKPLIRTSRCPQSSCCTDATRRPQRLLHSEAYIKYIEGLNKDSRSMCNWDRQLNASQEVSNTIIIYKSNIGNIFVFRLCGHQMRASCL